MKKILLSIAAVAACVTTNAQVTWTLESDLTGTSANTKIEVLETTIGAGLKNDGIDQYTYKDANGTATNYPWKALKLTPTNAQHAADAEHEKAYTEDVYRNIANASEDAQAMYINFSAQTIAVEDLLEVKGIEFDATRVGTDAVFVNARIIGNEGTYTSAWLINGDNAASVADGGAWVSKDAVGDAWMTTADAGFKPCRNDASKADTSAKCYTHFTLPAPTDLPEDLYQATVQIVVYGISNNKNAYLHGVKLNCGVAGETAVAGIAEAKAEVAAPVKVITANGVQIGNFNIAGQQVK